MIRTRYHPLRELIGGDTWTIDVTCKKTDSSALDISGASEVEWQFERISGDRIIFTKTLGDGIALLTDGKDGKLRVVVSDGETGDVGPGSYNDQLRITLNSAVSTISRGRLDVVTTLRPVQVVVALSLVSSRPTIQTGLVSLEGE